MEGDGYGLLIVLTERIRFSHVGDVRHALLGDDVRDSWSAVAQYKSRSAMHGYTYWPVTSYRPFTLGLCLPIKDRATLLSIHIHSTS